MTNPAEEASAKAFKELFDAVKAKKCFRLEAGAGAGKTYSLVKVLKHLIKKDAANFLKKNQQIACITYTNVAKDEINDRTDNHPVIYAETIHAFSWNLIKVLQQQMREFIPTISEKWKNRIEEAGGVKNQIIKYDLGYPKATKQEITLHHDDVIKIIGYFLSLKKFRHILKSKFPIILIDEYQDTNKDLAKSIVKNLIENDSGVLVGLFGDHWQKIYGSAACGLIKSETGKIIEIGKNANFRSEKNIVSVLNNMRPELPQNPSDPNSNGEILIFHSNDWNGEERLGGGHWKGDLPAEDAKGYRDRVKKYLETKGWEFAFEKTKVLMLTNNILAEEQGYKNLVSAFRDTDDYLKKNDHHIKFFDEVIEPVCEYFKEGQYGKMFKTIGSNTPKLKKQNDKKTWNKDLQKLIELRESSTIGEVIEHLLLTKHPRLSAKIEARVERFKQFDSLNDEEKEQEQTFYNKILKINKTKYIEMVELSKYINNKTPFSTKHGVKGAQFDNVLVVCGRGWNHYNWNQMLEWAQKGIPKGKDDTFERNRNLFYVVCSRPQKRLSVLFTQELSNDAIQKLENWFGKENIIGEPK